MIVCRRCRHPFKYPPAGEVLCEPCTFALRAGAVEAGKATKAKRAALDAAEEAERRTAWQQLRARQAAELES